MSRGIFHLRLGARKIFAPGIQPHCLNGSSRRESRLAHSWIDYNSSLCCLVLGPIRWGFVAPGGDALWPPGVSFCCRDGDLRFSKPASALGGQKLPTRILSETRGL